MFPEEKECPNVQRAGVAHGEQAEVFRVSCCWLHYLGNQDHHLAISVALCKAREFRVEGHQLVLLRGWVAAHRTLNPEEGTAPEAGTAPKEGTTPKAGTAPKKVPHPSKESTASQ